MLVDIAGRRRSPAPHPPFIRAGRPVTRACGIPPTVEEIIAVMRAAGDDADGIRLRGLIVVVWRVGLRISEALALAESDLDANRGAILVRHGKGRKRREVGMDRWGWEQLAPWLNLRSELSVGALFCILRSDLRTTVGLRRRSRAVTQDSRSCWGATAVRAASAPSCACLEMSREGASRLVIQRQLGHADLAIVCVYLRGIDNTEIVHAVDERPAPMIPADNGLHLGS